MKFSIAIVCLLMVSSSLQISAQNTELILTGEASFYHDMFEGRKTSSGERFHQRHFTCAHPSLPFGTLLQVTNLDNGKTVQVRVNDRGPFAKGRIIDLSKAAARKLDFVKRGVTDVRVEILNQPGDIPEETKPIASKTGFSHPDFTGFSIQVGFFSNKENMLKMVEVVKRELNAEVFVLEKSENSITGYAVLVGRFEDRGKAFGYLDRIFETFPGAFIAELKDSRAYFH